MAGEWNHNIEYSSARAGKLGRLARKPCGFATSSTVPMAGEWNHNIEYHRVLMAAFPASFERGLDVGCGDGSFTRVLAARARKAIGIDTHAESVDRARAHDAGAANVELIVDDFLTRRFDEPFDVIGAVASLHHMPLEPALQRMSEVLRPGATLGIVGIARTRAPIDLAYDAVGAVATRTHRRRRDRLEVTAPTMDPTTTYGQVRRAAAAILPGCRFRRHALFRYTIIWTKPA